MLFNNYLEKTGWDLWNVILYIWDKCPTNCYNCTRNSNSEEFYPYYKFEEVISFIESNCSKSVNIFLKWVEAIFHPDIELFILDKKLKWFNMWLHISPVFTNNRIDKIKELAFKFDNISFDTTFTIKTQDDLIKVLKFIKFTVKSNINCTLDLFIDYKDFLFIFLKIIKFYWFKYKINKSSSHYFNIECIELILNNRRQNILVYNTKKQEIINSTITNLEYISCLANDNILIKDNKIFFREEVEFNYNGDIKIHLNSYCSKWIQKISSIYNEWFILNDFLIFKKYMSKYSNDLPMWKNCFNCMNNPYNIDNN